MLDLRLSNAHGGRCIPRVIEGVRHYPEGYGPLGCATILLMKLRNLTSLTSVQYAPRGGVLAEGAREYALRWGVGVAGNATSILTTAPPSAGRAQNTCHVGAWE